MKLAFAITLGVILILIGVQVVSFLGQQHALEANLTDVQNKLVTAQNQEADLQEETQYLANPANLEKELRSNFNYKKPGETMIIIVPSQPATGTNP